MSAERAANMYAVYLGKKWRRRRNRRDRTRLIVDGFERQIQDIADSFESWELYVEENGVDATYALPEDARVQSVRSIYVVDLFQERLVPISFCVGDTTIAPTLVRQGLFPCTPYFATVVFTARTLNAFYSLRMRCPRLGKQAFLRGLNDMHGVAPRPYLQTQFSNAYDLFLRTKEIPNWRLKNCCPPCLYKVEGEVELDPPIILTIDGNNSLKRLHKTEVRKGPDGETVASGQSMESFDPRKAPRDYLQPEEEVNVFGKEHGEELLKRFLVDPKWSQDSGCSKGWHNMKEYITEVVRGIYDATGIVGTFCRHNVCYLICDMLRSGELAKYGLAAVHHILTILGKFRLGYDIGCKFEQWVYTHPLCAELAQKHGFEAVVGAFHGTGHRRLCQLLKMPIYTKGSGLEASENAESIFSKSNALAGTTRHASRFHRQQDIVEYFAHSDNFDALANVTSLFTTKYKHALEIMSQEKQLVEAMEGLGLDPEDRSVFGRWLLAEQKALEKLPIDPPEETMKMEYCRRLVDLEAAKEKFEEILGEEMVFLPPEDTPGYQELEKQTRKREAERRRVIERYEHCQTVVEDLERRLELETRWTTDSTEWQEAATSVREHRYRRALDRLQTLIVGRLLQLSKANMVETGYQMRKHIAKAIQSSSKSLQKALSVYNSAAQELGDRPLLTWEEILDMRMLDDFDLLRLAREDIREAAWARPGARMAMDLFFKLVRSREELVRLNIEIKRFVTWMKEEKEFLQHHEGRLVVEGHPARALQVRKYRMLQGRFYGIHRARLLKLSKLDGFTGSIEPGTGVCPVRRSVQQVQEREMEVDEVEQALQNSAAAERENGGDDGEAGEDHDTDDEGELEDHFEAVLKIAEDNDEGEREE
ncbi:hypothetical protein MKEN_01153400 [Mycena kentingensis (nom. inval.)]|nr:hypothetical protein MKEN_01153400 [Mycena kentingensis (nom. inval.)]